MPPATIAPMNPNGVGQIKTTMAASAASVTRGASGVRLRAMPQIACATTGTATTSETMEPAQVELVTEGDDAESEQDQRQRGRGR